MDLWKPKAKNKIVRSWNIFNSTSMVSTEEKNLFDGIQKELFNINY